MKKDEKKVYVVMQSTESHDAYDNFMDFCLGVKLGACGFIHTFTFEFPENEMYGRGWGSNDPEEMQDIVVFGTQPVNTEDEKELSSRLYAMRESGNLHARESMSINGTTYECFAWYEDALDTFAKETGRELPVL